MFAISISPSAVSACSPSMEAAVPETATTSGLVLTVAAGAAVGAAAGAAVGAAATGAVVGAAAAAGAVVGAAGAAVGAAAGGLVGAAAGAAVGAGGALEPHAASSGSTPNAAVPPTTMRRNCRRVGRRYVRANTDSLQNGQTREIKLPPGLRCWLPSSAVLRGVPDAASLLLGARSPGDEAGAVSPPRNRASTRGPV